MDPKSRLARIIRFVMRDVTYHKQYVCSVQSQDGMTLDLKPDDPKLDGNGLGAVPLLVGLPGFTVEVSQGARVRLHFDNGDPSQPKASLFDVGSMISVTFGEGVQAVARMGDLVECGGFGTTVVFTPVTPAGGPVMPGIPYLVSFGPTAQPQFPLYGCIATGRLEFKS